MTPLPPAATRKMNDEPGPPRRLPTINDIHAPAATGEIPMHATSPSARARVIRSRSPHVAAISTMRRVPLHAKP